MDFYNYQNYISLGYFCSVAMDLERIGLRSASYPFDWIIADFEGVVKAISNGFEDFLNLENMAQQDNDPSHYYDVNYNFGFYHDFNQYKSLESQLLNVKEKYNRRIKRFYEDVKNPTLFIRYISDELLNDDGKSIELQYIEKNHEQILAKLRKFNKENDIVYVGNSNLSSKTIQIYHVTRDENDTVSREPLYNNMELNEMLQNVIFPSRVDNIIRYKAKQKRNHKLIVRLKKKLISIYNENFRRVYCYKKIIYI